MVAQGEGSQTGFLKRGEVADTGQARQWFGEVPAGLPPTPASVNEENVSSLLRLLW